MSLTNFAGVPRVVPRVFEVCSSKPELQHLSLFLGAQYKQHFYPIEIFRAQNPRIIKIGRDLWDHKVQLWLLMGWIMLSIFLQRNPVSLKRCIQKLLLIYSTSKADLYPSWKKIRCSGYPGSTDPEAQGTCSAFGYKQKRQKLPVNVS